MHAQLCTTLFDPVDCRHPRSQAPLFIGFSRQEYWSELPFPTRGIFLTQGWNLCLLHLQADSLSLSYLGKLRRSEERRVGKEC